MQQLKSVGTLAVQSTYTEIDRLLQWTVPDDLSRYDVPRQFQTRQRRGQLHCSYPQLKSNETLWGNHHYRRGVFHQLASCTNLQCSGGKAPTGMALHNSKVRHSKFLYQRDKYRRGTMLEERIKILEKEHIFICLID